MLHNEEVWSNTIYSSSEASGVNNIIHRRLRWMICFNESAARVENMVLVLLLPIPFTYELCN